MRLTIDLLRKAPQFNNAILQREIDLRGLSISLLDENVLLLLENNFDVINLTANALTALEFFPLGVGVQGERKPIMDRVVTLIAHRNQIRKVNIMSCVMALPNVSHFLADHNNLRALKDLYFLKFWKKLEVISLEANPLWDRNAENYDEGKIRSFIVFLCPHVKLINYSRVTQADRRASDENRQEFKTLMAQWESESNGTIRATTDVEGGKKMRKRGREMRRTGVADAASTTETVATGENRVSVGESRVPLFTPDNGVDNEDIEYENLQRRLEELEAKILCENTTPAEISAMEEEFNEITIQVERSKKRRTKQ